MDYKEIISTVLKHEGGYVHDPKDLGGETNFGITKRWYPDIDIKNLTKEKAVEIYKKDYWDRFKLDEFPKHLQHIYFDMVVNMGVRNAGKVIQRACNSKGSKLVVDGIAGSGTRQAVKNCRLEHDRIKAFRIRYYCDLINAKPEQEKFFYGWVRRSLEV
jgi:lysozyme family protein